VTADPNPLPDVVEISNPVGAAMLIFAVRFEPDTEYDCSADV
jgi:hypothetical protein